MLPLRDHQPTNTTSLITYLIITVTGIALFIEFSSPDLQKFLFEWALVPSRVGFSNPSTWYPFITSIFLHGGLLHFASNMWFLKIFGDNVEEDLGSIKYLTFYLVGGIIASLAQYIFISNQLIPVLGASGAVAAVLGYYFIRFPNHKITTLIPFFGFITTANLPSNLVLGLWFLTQFLNGTISLGIQTSATSGIAWWAHIGGFLFGILAAKVVGATRINKI